MNAAADASTMLDMVLITGMSGSGKSVALHALEDAGYYCVDNLPPELLLSFVALEKQHGASKVAIAMDVRSAVSLPLVPQQLRQMRAQGVAVQSVFLDASTDTLVRRFSETRRLHPLSRRDASDQHRALVDAIDEERELLGELREHAHVIDTSMIRSSQLQGYVKALISSPAAQLTLVFQSFAFKRGVPVDADYVFDVRMLPNPHYESGLRALTGKDAEVVNYLQAHAEVDDMFRHIEQFIAHWL
ncbi:MAG: RNase adapter RapZ, partial [Polaromonas sp.]